MVESTAHPLLIGRGPWGQKIAATLDTMHVQYTLCGKETAQDCIKHARERGNTHVLIATPLSTHYELCTAAFQQKLPVFCEKPLAPSYAECELLMHEWAIARHPRFLVDSVHLFAEGFENVRMRVAFYGWGGSRASFAGDGPDRPDCSALWDYGWHAVGCLLSLGVPVDKLAESFSVSNRAVEKRAKLGVGPFFYDGYGKHNTPPLQRALEAFFDSAHDVASDYRFGFQLPLAVTRALEAIGPSTPAAQVTSLVP